MYLHSLPVRLGNFFITHSVLLHSGSRLLLYQSEEHEAVSLWKSEGNLQDWVSSSTMWVSVMELKLGGKYYLLSTLTCLKVLKRNLDAHLKIVRQKCFETLT